MTIDQTKIEIEASKDGNFVVLTISPTGGTPVTLELPAAYAGPIAVDLLNAVIDCANTPGRHATDFKKVKDHLPFEYAHARAVGLGNTDQPNVVLVTFAIGVTELNIGLSRTLVQLFGRSLLALSADESRRQ